MTRSSIILLFLTLALGGSLQATSINQRHVDSSDNQAPPGYKAPTSPAELMVARNAVELDCEGAFLEDLPPHTEPGVDLNGGCNATPYMAQSLHAHTCGTIFTFTYNGSNWRDIDWYEFSLEEQTTLSINAQTDPAVEFYVVVRGNYSGTRDCEDDYDLSTYTGELGVFSFDITLAAGDYWLLIGTYAFSGHPEPISYSMTVQGLPTGPVAEADELSTEFALRQNYPNPFNPSTKIEFTLTETAMTRLQVFDLSGALVGTLVNGLQDHGTHTVNFDASGLPSGVYYYRLQSGNQFETRKMVLLR